MEEEEEIRDVKGRNRSRKDPWEGRNEGTGETGMWTKFRRVGRKERSKRKRKIRNRGDRNKECKREVTGIGRSERGTREGQETGGCGRRLEG